LIWINCGQQKAQLHAGYCGDRAVRKPESPARIAGGHKPGETRSARPYRIVVVVQDLSAGPLQIIELPMPDPPPEYGPNQKNQYH
jgi:hypothetical protein